MGGYRRLTTLCIASVFPPQVTWASGTRNALLTAPFGSTFRSALAASQNTAVYYYSSSQGLNWCDDFGVLCKLLGWLRSLRGAHYRVDRHRRGLDCFCSQHQPSDDGDGAALAVGPNHRALQRLG